MTEGSGVGVRKEPPVDVCGGAGRVVPLRLLVSLLPAASVEVRWDTLLVGRHLYVEISAGLLPDGSKESFITLLEYAEETLKCRHVIVCFKKSRIDRASLVRTFMFIGFVVVAPGSQLAPACAADAMYMAYSIDDDDDDDDDDIG